MSDERGGRYFREARFFLVGDKAVAQSHILDARGLMGYMRDMYALGGPAVQMQHTQLPDGTVIRAVMLNGQYQAQIVSPIGVTKPEVSGEVVFIFGVVEVGPQIAQVIYRPTPDQFVVIVPLVYTGSPSFRNYPEHTNYWYGVTRDASTGLGATKVEPVTLYPASTSVWSAGGLYNQWTNRSPLSLLGSAVWQGNIVDATRSGTTFKISIRTPLGGIVPPPVVDTGTVLPGEVTAIAKFAPTGGSAAVIKKSTPANNIDPTPGSYVLAHVAETDDPLHPYSATYSVVEPPLQYEKQIFYWSSPITTVITDTRGNTCPPFEFTYTQHNTTVPGRDIAETIVAVGFDNVGNNVVLTRLQETLSSRTGGEVYNSTVVDYSEFRDWHLDTAPFYHNWTKRTETYTHTRAARITTTTSRVTYKLNGAIVHSFELVETVTDEQVVRGHIQSETSYAHNSEFGSICGNYYIYPYSGPIVRPITWPYVDIDTGEPDVPVPTTRVGEMADMLWCDLRAHVFVFRKYDPYVAGDNTSAIVVVTRHGEFALPQRNTDLSSDSAVPTVQAAAHFDKVLIHIRHIAGDLSPVNQGVFLVTVADSGTAVVDVTDRIPNGWTPNNITLCADVGLVEAQP